jgi:hypothetical protein
LSILPEIRRIAQENPDDRATGYVRLTPALVVPEPQIVPQIPLLTQSDTTCQKVGLRGLSRDSVSGLNPLAGPANGYPRQSGRES